MEELRRAVRREGFARLADHMARVGRSDDPMADLARLGWAYWTNAVENPDLYRVMFMESAIDDADAEVGLYTFQMLVDAMKRCVDEGRFNQADPEWLATQAWAMIHGVVALYVAGMFDLDTVARAMFESARNQFLAFGDDPKALERSFASADFGTVPTTA
jgi:hypothetical protein